MIYRIVTVWQDIENEIPIIRCAQDFDAPDAAERYIADVIKAGVMRIETTHAPIPIGGCLATVYVPVHHIVGWYVYELPDDTPPVTGKLH